MHVVFLLCLAQLAATTQAAVINQILPNKGSLLGGTTLTILGSGFERDYIEGSTSTYIGSDLCTAIPYYSSDTQLVCITPPFPTSTTPPPSPRQTVTVALHSFAAQSFARCDGECVFEYSESSTPRVTSFTRAATSGELITIGGTLRGSSEDQYSIKVNGLFCSAALDQPTLVDGKGVGSVSCRMPDQPAGYYDLLVNVQDESTGLGDAGFAFGLQRSTPNSPLDSYRITQVPSIASLSHSRTGSLGGDSLVITGTGFSADTAVLIHDSPCTVTATTATQITCSTPAAPSSTPSPPFLGSRGLRLRVWYDRTSYVSDPSDPSAPTPDIDRVQIDSAIGHASNFADRYAQQLDGFFVPPVTGNYTFFIKGDDVGDVYLSSVKVCELPRYQSSFWNTPEQSSSPVHLQSGTPYPIRIRHREGTGGDYFSVGMRLHNSGAPPLAETSTFPEVQRIELDALNRREVQTVSVMGAVAGTFALFYEGTSVSDSLPYDASDSQVRDAVKSLQSCKSISVSSTPGRTWRITFNCPSSSSRPLLTPFNTGLSVNASDASATLRLDSAREQTPSKPVSGTFQLRVSANSTTDPIPFDASASELQAALEATSPATLVSVSRSGVVGDGASWRIIWRRPSGDMPQLQVLSALLGDNVTATATTLQDGSNDALFDPIPMDWFFVDAPTPQARVQVNDVWALCDDCSFTYNASLTPTVSAITSSSSTSAIAAADELTIDGTKFHPNASFNTVLLGSHPCEITAASETQLTCTVPHLPASSYTVEVIVRGAGKAQSSAASPFTFALSASSATPSSGSQAGGTIVTVDGSGFNPDTPDSVTIDGSACEPVSITFSTFTCRTPAGAGTAPLLFNGANASTPILFTYSAALTPTVSSVAPSTISSAKTTSLVVTGTGFTMGALTITVGSRPCGPVTDISPTSISCSIIRQAPLPFDEQVPYTPLVHVAGRGYALVADDTHVQIALRVQAVSHSAGSLAGGTYLTITGQGFHSDMSLNTVNLTTTSAFALCTINAAVSNSTHIVCVTTAWPEYADDDLSALAPDARVDTTIQITSNAISAACDGDCPTFAYERAKTPVVTALAPETITAGTTVTISGDDFEPGVAAITLGGTECTVTSTNGSTVECSAGADVAGAKDASVRIADYGFAYSPFSTTHVLRLESLSATTGSLGGGHRLVITGSGFSQRTQDNVVRLLNPNEETATQVPPSIFLPARGFPHAPRSDINTAEFYRDGQTDWLAITPWDVQASTSRTFDEGLAGVYDLIFHGVGEDDGSPYFWIHVDDSLVAEFRTPTTTDGSAFAEGEAYDYTVSGISLAPSATIKVTGRTHSLSQTGIGPASATALARWSGITLVPRTAGLATTVVSATFTQITIDTPAVDWGFAFHDVPLDLHVRVISTDPGVPGPSEDAAVSSYADCTSPTACRYTFSNASTPVLTSATASGVTPASLLTLSGTGFGSTQGSSSVTVASAPCSPETWSDIEITCTLSAGVPASSTEGHLPRIFIASSGVAVPPEFSVNPAVMRVVSSLSVTSSSSDSLSYAGGSTLLINGAGFSQDTTVTVCGEPCPVTSSSYGAISCTSPPLVTQRATSTWDNVVGRVGEITLAHYSAEDDALIDGSVASDGSCTDFELDFGASTQVQVERVRFFPQFQQEELLEGGSFEGSTDGSMWTELAAVPARVQQGWNFVDVDPPVLVRHIRFVPPKSSCIASEFALEGIVVRVPASQPDADRETCSVTVTAPTADASADTTAMYALSATPTVTGISPAFGSSLGGEAVQITGTGFADVSTVSLNGIACSVQSVSSTSISCTAGARSSSDVEPVSVSVAVNSASAIVNTAERFRYLDRWSALTTWKNGDPPVEGDTVLIPEGQTVLLDVSPPELFLLLIQGELVFDRQDLTLDASYIFVQGGKLEIGTEEDPFLHNAVITLHGDRRESIELPFIGAKVLAVAPRTFSSSRGVRATIEPESTGSKVSVGEFAGVLDIHGRPRRRVWTFLGSSSPAGSRTLVTESEVDFEQGDRLLVTSSSHNMYEAEEVVVESLAADNRTITLTAGLQHAHTVDWYQDPLGKFPPTRLGCEVALLSRNVIVQGDEESDSQLFGAHTIAMRGSVYHVENAELRRCGQAFILGRYCTHFHLNDVQTNSYVRANSIHHSFQRATTVHGTHHARVQDNVAYHVMGHTFFVEDGNEHYNVFEGNLAAITLPCQACIKSDTEPASYWTPIPLNYWRHNVASGSVNYGFWFELVGRPGGPSYTPFLCPSTMPLGEFFNNTAHSNNVHGLRVYPFYAPRADLSGCSGAAAPQTFENLTSFRNRVNGIFNNEVGDLHHVNARLLENGGDEVFIKELVSVPYGWNPHLHHLLAVASIDPDRVLSGDHKHAIFSPQSERYFVDDALFVNYGQLGVLAGCAECNMQTALKQGGYTVRFKRLQFINSQRRTHWTEPKKQIFFDLDGSLTGHVHGTVTPFYAFNVVGPHCSAQSTLYDDGVLCDGDVRVRRLSMDLVRPRELDWFDAVLTNADGASDRVKFRPKESYGWVVPLVTHARYQWAFDEGQVDWRSLRLRYSEWFLVDGEDSLSPALPTPEWATLQFAYNDYRWAYAVDYRGDLQPWLAAAPSPSDPFGASLFNNVSQTFELGLAVRQGTVTAQTYQLGVQAMQCPFSGCPVPPPPEQAPPAPWSDPTSWPLSKVPSAGENVVIEADMHIVLDITPPRLGMVRVEGTLEFSDDSAKTFEAESLLVTGNMIVGTPDSPFRRTAVIRLMGQRTSQTVIVSNDLFVGNNVLAVFGSLSVHGQAVATPWTRLATTAVAGSTQIQLVEPVDWAVGSTIGITATEFSGSGDRVSEIESSTATIVGVSGGGTVLSLAAPLNHTFFAGVADAASGTTLRAAVALLDRSVRIESGGVGPDPMYGGHVFVGAFDQFVGEVSLGNVQFVDMGKRDLEHSSLEFVYPAGIDSCSVQNVVQGCTFTNNWNYAVVAMSTCHLELRDSVVWTSTRSAIDVDLASSGGAHVVGNLVVDTRRRPDETTDWVRPLAAFTFGGTPMELSGNLAADSADAGFAFVPESCDESRVFDNEAVATMIGAFLLPAASASPACQQLTRFTAWKNSHMGVFGIDQSAGTLRLDRLTLADNHIGVSANFLWGEAGGRAGLSDVDANPNGAVITNSVVLGSSAASSCDASVTCRAATESDVAGTSSTCGSVMGSGFRRVGIVAPQWLNRGKTCRADGGLDVCRPPNTPERLCSLPWENRYGLPSTLYGRLHVLDTHFGGFNSSACASAGRSVALSVNPTNPDFTPPMRFRGITWADDVVRADKAQLGTVSGRSLDVCETGCDAINMVLGEDIDGSFTGSVSMILGGNPPLAAPAPRCVGVSEWPGFSCPDLTIRPVVMRSLDRDSGRPLGPVEVRRRLDEEDASSDRVSFSRGFQKDNCAKKKPFGRYLFGVEPGQKYSVFTTNSMPASTRFEFQSSDPSESCILSIFYNQPLKLTVFSDGQLVAPIKDRPLELTDPSGANQFDPQRRQIDLVMRGSASGTSRYEIRTEIVVQVTLHIEMSVQDFYGENVINNLALLLQIAPERIKIVDVREGSAIVDMEIVEAEPLQQANQTMQHLEEMEQVFEAVGERIADGSVREIIAQEFAGAPILDTRVTLTALDGTSREYQESSDSDEVFFTTATGLAVAGGLFAALALFSVGAWMYSKNRQRAAVYQASNRRKGTEMTAVVAGPSSKMKRSPSKLADRSTWQVVNVEPAEDASGSSGSDEWEQLETDDGLVYFYNARTKERRWEDPNQCDPEPFSAGAGESSTGLMGRLRHMISGAHGDGEDTAHMAPPELGGHQRSDSGVPVPIASEEVDEATERARRIYELSDFMVEAQVQMPDMFDKPFEGLPAAFVVCHGLAGDGKHPIRANDLVRVTEYDADTGRVRGKLYPAGQTVEARDAVEVNLPATILHRIPDPKSRISYFERKNSQVLAERERAEFLRRQTLHGGRLLHADHGNDEEEDGEED